MHLFGLENHKRLSFKPTLRQLFRSWLWKKHREHARKPYFIRLFARYPSLGLSLMFICQSQAILIVFFSRFMVSIRVPPSLATNVIEVKWYQSYWMLLAWAAIVVGIFIGWKELVYWVVDEKPRDQVRRCRNIKLFHILWEALHFALARILRIEERTGGFSTTTSSSLSDQSWHVPPVARKHKILAESTHCEGLVDKHSKGNLPICAMDINVVVEIHGRYQWHQAQRNCGCWQLVFGSSPLQSPFDPSHPTAYQTLYWYCRASTPQVRQRAHHHLTLRVQMVVSTWSWP